MAVFRRLADGSVTERRSGRDALEVLRTQAEFRDEDRASFHVVNFRLPSGQEASFIEARYGHHPSDTVAVVGLPPSKCFRAVKAASNEWALFDTSLLHEATINANGDAVLADGTRLFAIDLVPLPLLIEPSDLDWTILRLSLRIIGATHCWRNFDEGVPHRYRAMVPDGHRLDWSRLPGLRLPPLKVLCFEIRQRDKALTQLSDQQVVNTLRRFGIRIPKGRPRKKRLASATN